MTLSLAPSLSYFLFWLLDNFVCLHLSTNGLICGGMRPTFCVNIDVWWFVYIFGFWSLFVLYIHIFEWLSLWLLFKIVNDFDPSEKNFHLLFMWNVAILLKIWVSVLINTDELNSAHNQTNMIVRIRWGQIKFHRQYVNYLDLVVTSHVTTQEYPLGVTLRTWHLRGLV